MTGTADDTAAKAVRAYRGATTFSCWIEGNDEDPRQVRALDAWMAAKKFADLLDADAGGEMAQSGLRPGHDGWLVTVLSPDDTETRLRVWPEAEVRWYARVEA